MTEPLKHGDRVERIDPSSLTHQLGGTVEYFDAAAGKVRIQWDSFRGKPSRSKWVALDAEGKRWKRAS